VTPDKAVLCGLLLAAAAAAVLVSPLSPIARQAGGVSGLQGVTWSPSQPAGHQTVGGLWHPPTCGQGRTGLIKYGYGWIAGPPSESTPGLGQDG
jgi:hypothetical protein